MKGRKKRVATRARTKTKEAKRQHKWGTRRSSVCANFAHTAPDRKPYGVEHYNLDVVISVGYRVKSPQGTQFRVWATQTLRDHLIRGYTLHEKRLRERGLSEAQQAIELLSNTLKNQSLVTDEGCAVLDVVQQYTRAWRLLKRTGFHTSWMSAR